MHLGAAYIMLTGPRPGIDSPANLGYGIQTLTVIVADVGAHFDKAKREGAIIWEELHETVYGERQYGLEDLDGHRWLFSQHARDVDPKEWGATIVAQVSWLPSRWQTGTISKVVRMHVGSEGGVPTRFCGTQVHSSGELWRQC